MKKMVNYKSISSDSEQITNNKKIISNWIEHALSMVVVEQNQLN